MYDYQSLDRHNISRCIEFIANNFVNDEPTTRHLGIGLDEFMPFSDRVCHHAMKEDLSVLALDRVEKKIVGAIVGYDYARSLPAIENLCAKWLPVLELLRELDDAIAPRLSEHRVNYLPVMAIAKEHRSNPLFAGLMGHLAEKSLRQGFTQLYSQETSEYRFRVSSFPGKVSELGATKYSDFVFRNAHPFAALAGRCVAISTKIEAKGGHS